MTNAQAIDEIHLRLNKLSTEDADNIETWKKEEAINKGIDEWIRRQKRGNNARKDGAEESDGRIDDLSVLLKDEEFTPSNKDLFAEIEIPEDYRYFNRITPIVSSGKCNNIRIKSDYVEEANVDEYLSDYNSSPSFKFEETFHTQIDGKFRIYHNKDFVVDKVKLTYYRNPAKIVLSDINYVWEFREDVCRLILDEAVKIIAGDTENVIQYQLAEKRSEENN